MKQLPAPQCTLFLSCPADVSIQRIVEGRANTSGRPDDADYAKVAKRVEDNNRESGEVLRALEENGVRIIRIDASRDEDSVRSDIHAQFHVVFQEWRQSRWQHRQ
ncbi:hypothetical protein GGR56DRAFT_642904 [Xylariaceae sp. FL0804]|nr:hypothetical protein GGR56DRAFT_642904 [Xylariaceae sp. FL0804]